MRVPNKKKEIKREADAKAGKQIPVSLAQRFKDVEYNIEFIKFGVNSIENKIETFIFSC